ncbi:4'-phosphopantetheinyl transferase superfamily protein [Iodobacter sp. LRB]|uniref:4'-phosphopantetheinyl transferase family protein n=1 Tax=unclassified Iodobacter TaxID=235634 RepID=UPI000C119862|nr:4'-phosphopantetheinyl transferase superfamily protein [Iodobacter sp. BJB302]PHV03194.1 hypothetical protein CSQ88_02625 [Iodobacter sp. BJB302]
MLKIWRVYLDDAAWLSGPGLAVLDEQEHQRWQSLRRALDANRYAAAHIALRAVLASELDCLPADIRYQHNPWCKPFLHHGPAFSLSHSGGIALIALQPLGPLGIDIELHNNDTDPDWFSDFQSPAELRKIAQPLSAAQALKLWVRKEAVLKAFGRGLHLPMSQVVLPQGENRRMRAMIHCESENTLWHLYDLDVGIEALAALVSRRSYTAQELQVKDWPAV